MILILPISYPRFSGFYNAQSLVVCAVFRLPLFLPLHCLSGGWGIVVVVIVQLPMYSVHITTTVVSSNPVHDGVYSIQHYVIKFANDLRQVGGILRVLRISPPIKLTATI